MKRGFLLKAADKRKEKAAADQGCGDHHDDSTPKTAQLPPPPEPTNQQKSMSIDELLSIPRLPYGNLTEQQKALPKDYPKTIANLSILPRDFARTDTSSEIETLFTTVPDLDDVDGSTQWIIKHKDAKAKLFATPGFPARIPKPRPGLFEVRATSDMGQGVFAKRNINRGELVFSERPLIISPNWMPADEREDYSVDQIRQVQIFEFEKQLKIAIQRMLPKDRALYMALHNSHTADGSGPLLGVLRTNGFTVSELSDSGPLCYAAVCNLGSRINHSCKPNVKARFKLPSFSFQFIATQDIKPGAQLFYCYCPLEDTKAEREAELARYGFACDCSACVNATPATDELRKTFNSQIHHLSAWVNQPDWSNDALVHALLLEADMVAEGLDGKGNFYSLPTVIYVGLSKLGKISEMEKHRRRIKEYYKLRDTEEPCPV